MPSPLASALVIRFQLAENGSLAITPPPIVLMPERYWISVSPSEGRRQTRSLNASLLNSPEIGALKAVPKIAVDPEAGIVSARKLPTVLKPTSWPLSLMPTSPSLAAPGLSTVVNWPFAPPLYKKPWRLIPTRYSPITCPALLTPSALVLTAFVTGSSNWVDPLSPTTEAAIAAAMARYFYPPDP